jgi:hypothetical protein
MATRGSAAAYNLAAGAYVPWGRRFRAGARRGRKGRTVLMSGPLPSSTLSCVRQKRVSRAQGGLGVQKSTQD